MAKEMNKRDKEAFKFFLSAWQRNWKLNQYYRTWYDEDLESYRGYRDQLAYPMKYSLSFNKLLPRVMTVMSRFMEQLYQAGTGDLISVKPRKRADVERAPRVAALLNYQHECLNDIDAHGGSYLVHFQWLFNATNFGKGIVKAYWHKEERIAPRRYDIPIPKFGPQGQVVGMDYTHVVIEEQQIIYDGPYLEVIHNKLFNPDPQYRSIQKMPFVGCLYKRSIDYLKKKEREGVYRNTNKLGWTGGSKSGVYGEDSAEAFAKSLEIEGAFDVNIDQERTEYRTPMVDVIEGYGRYIFPEDDSPYEVGSGYKIKGAESEAVVHIGNYKTILSLEKNKYGIRPFFDIGCYYHPELFWDIGLMRLGRGLQEQYDSFANLRHQNAMMLVNQMIKVREDADIDPAALIWKPYGIIPVEQMDDVDVMATNDVFQSGVFKEQSEFFENTISDMTGLYPYNLGQQPPRQEYVGTVYSLQSMGEARTKLLMMTMDHTGFRPLLKYMMLLNTWHLPSDVEARIYTNQGETFVPLFAGDIHPDYDFSARYTGLEPALGKQFRIQQLIQYAQMWAESPYLQHYQFMRAILELMDFHDSDRYLKSPEQVQAEMQQQAQQAAQQQMMGFEMQKQLEGQKADAALQKEMVKGLLKG